MTVTMSDAGALRHWLDDYLVTNVGCGPTDVDSLCDALLDIVESAQAGSGSGVW
jgi:hypothetical protein